ncbi:class I SAM-dependent methyltransferase [Kaustia mangrovi]|uniref:Class I SAM-dependent methyltransferase n=1 Tax=Kaustia mangrovi TaxID=2593653 RepID=A0A7S8C5I0_9HYPH|nr:class I SAM-dependent methyltransferase [Kaustia mangrovi]QPC43732.1 class I SAM-dependent methyltransferase [Kaustia mangrovi]
MPELSTPLHLDKLRKARERGLIDRHGLYGLQWGDPDERPDLRGVRDRFVWPFVHPDRVAVEIGPGGGRWTRYLLPCRMVYVVDYHQELLDLLAQSFRAPNLAFVKNGGTDFPGIPAGGVDFVFSYGTFVHFELDLIARYLDEIAGIVRPGGDVVIQYADKTKPVGEATPSFGDCDPERMAALCRDRGYTILEQDDALLNNSGIVRLTR